MNPLTKIILREYQYLRKKPVQAAFELTYQCNCRCLSCNVWKLPLNDKELTFREIVSAIGQMRKMGVKEISFVGAEPFMRPDLLPLVKYVKEQGSKCIVTTNATLIDKDTAKKICQAGLDQLVVSIDTIGENHDALRAHKGAFNKAICAIDYLKEAKKELGKSRPLISLHATLSNMNAGKLAEIFKLKETLGVDSLGFSYACQTKKEDFAHTVYEDKRIASQRLVFEDRILNFTDEDIAALKNQAKQLKKQKIKLPFSLRSLLGWQYSNLKDNIVPVEKCYAACSMITISPCGDILPCSNLDGFKYGNIRRDNLPAILNSPQRKKFLKRLSADFFPACRSCTNASLTPVQLFRVLLGLSIKDKCRFV